MIPEISKNKLVFFGFGLLVYGAYKYYVPSEYGDLGSLRNSKATEVLFKENHWEEHGYVDLPHGTTHYYFLGPADGKRIVFVHGMVTPSPVISPFLDLLAERGYRILCFDLYGRGYSDSPGVIYDNGLFIAQLANLLQYFNWKNVTVMGYSLGGAIAAGYVSRYPDWVSSVVFIAPAGLMKGLGPLAKALQYPILGSVVYYSIARKWIINGNKQNHLFNPSTCPNLVPFNEIQEYHINNNPGVLRAFKSTVIHFDFQNQHSAFEKIGNTHENRVLCIWGDEDRTVDTCYSKDVEELIPSVTLKFKHHATHSIVVEYPEFMDSTIHEYLESI
ncbi:Alpha/Beta hydrolase protein [Globomyces pollinis-pini]|nr:Alpha/Beta hydrolase protein [Globomyces pollinis-pini]